MSMKHKIQSVILAFHDRVMIVILFVVYLVLVVPLSVVARLTNNRKLPTLAFAESSWIDIDGQKRDDSYYTRQF